jgi:hypothetical protein
MGDKEYICEHDIFQLLDLDLTLKGFAGEEGQISEKYCDSSEMMINEMPVDYCINHMPVISQQIFIDAFAYDFSQIFGEMQMKIP